ncbi:DinB family protein [Peterkaempfera bronchialis]|uniref:DinB family protein n=1 Tax=Peterkaempfera bronchialis TaxID=2126346 RepID=A0A345T5X8_9ACTN|nr:DinB family protein [Peterkaempfera bronchialis]AXI81383.1 DinB family protein [Peterkaempfera bronchialis]
MPELVREVTDERDALLAFLAAQRGGLRRALLGVGEEQAAARPTAGTLSLGGLVKHVARTEQGWVSVILAGRPDPDPEGWMARWHEQFTMGPGETVAGLLARYAEVARETEEIVRALPDLEGTVSLPQAPWFPPDGTRSARWVLLHVIEETARHAGHADIVRESLDGATAFALLDAASKGKDGNA